MEPDNDPPADVVFLSSVQARLREATLLLRLAKLSNVHADIIHSLISCAHLAVEEYLGEAHSS